MVIKMMTTIITIIALIALAAELRRTKATRELKKELKEAKERYDLVSEIAYKLIKEKEHRDVLEESIRKEKKERINKVLQDMNEVSNIDFGIEVLKNRTIDSLCLNRFESINFNGFEINIQDNEFYDAMHVEVAVFKDGEFFDKISYFEKVDTGIYYVPVFKLKDLFMELASM